MLVWLILASCIFATIFLYSRHRYSYWRKIGIPYLKPVFPIGNGPLSLPKGIAIGTISKKFYDEFKLIGCRLGGVYFGFEPKLVVMDPEYADDILKRDFAHFVDRGFYLNENSPMTINIVTQKGNDWRISRAKFSNLFTSVKMKMMFDTLKLCSKDLEDHLEKEAKLGNYVDILDSMACYTTDVIGSVIFGIECHSFKNSESPFRKIGKSIFAEFTLYERIQMYLCNFYPDFAQKIGVTNVQSNISDFFLKYIKDTIDYRERNNVHRNDFIQMLIEMKSVHNISLGEMAAQTFLFFAAGYETSASTAALFLFELGLHPEIQEKIKAEIKSCLKKYNGDITYEAIKEMTLFHQAFNETLRKYPIVATLTRVCVQDYTFKDSEFTIPKGMRVLIPVLGYHRDPDYYPDPLEWDISRFNDSETKHIGYLPFGDGPRNCIGFRFGIMQVKMGLISVLKNHSVTADPNVKLPLQLDPDTFLIHITQKLLVKLHRDI